MKKILLLCALTSLGSSLYAETEKKADKVEKEFPRSWFVEPFVGGMKTVFSETDISAALAEIGTFSNLKTNTTVAGGLNGGLMWDNIPGLGPDRGLLRLSTGVFFCGKVKASMSLSAINPGGGANLDINANYTGRLIRVPFKLTYNFLRTGNFMMTSGVGFSVEFLKKAKFAILDAAKLDTGTHILPKGHPVLGLVHGGFSWTFRDNNRITFNYEYYMGKVQISQALEIGDAAAGAVVPAPNFANLNADTKTKMNYHVFYVGYIRDF